MGKLRVNDFSGGITDHYIGGPTNMAETMDNLLIDKNKKVYQRPGSEPFTGSQLGTGAQSINGIEVLKRENDAWFVLAVSSDHLYRTSYIGGTWTEVTGPVDGNDMFTGIITGSGKVTFVPWRNMLYGIGSKVSGSNVRPIRMYINGSVSLAAQTAGLPAPSGTVTMGLTGGGAGVSYGYAFVYIYAYTNSDGTSYLDVSEPLYTTASSGTGSAIGAGTPNSISTIPTLSNGTSGCWQTNAIDIQIYRTEDNGTVYYYVGVIDNGTTTYSDTTTDATLVNNAMLYTTGGRAVNGEVPKAGSLVVVDDTGYWASIAGEEKRLYQSIPGDIDSVPPTFYLDFPEDLLALGIAKNKPLAFTRIKAYRIEGRLDEYGGGYLSYKEIGDVGCCSPSSVVNTEEGCFFWSLQGPCFSDGYSVVFIGGSLQDTFASLLSGSTSVHSSIASAYDKHNKRIYWAINTEGGWNNNIIYVYDLTWKSFTTLTGGTSFAPNSLTILDIVGSSGSNRWLLRGTDKGYVMKHPLDLTDSEIYTDPVYDSTTADATAWETQAVATDYKSCAINYGESTLKKWVTKLTLTAKKITDDLTIRPKIGKDLKAMKNMREMRFRAADTPLDGIVIKERRTPAGAMRQTYTQVEFLKDDTIIACSDDYCTGTVNVSAKTVVLDDSTTYDWPTSIVNMKIYFSQDDYATGYTISVRAADTITLSSATGLSDGSDSWVIKGVKKDEMFYMEEYTIDYMPFSESVPGYQSGESGENE